MFRNLLLTSTAFVVCGLFAAECVPSSSPGATSRLPAPAVERPWDIRITPEVGVVGAQRLVREAVKAGRNGEINVVFAPGEYRFGKPLVLDEKLDFPKNGRVVWRAETPGMTVFSGAGAGSFPIEMPAAGDPNLALVPEKARPFVRCLRIPGEGTLPGWTGVGCGGRPKIEEYGPELFVAGRRLVPARWPEKGDWLYTGECFGEKRHQEIAFGQYREVIAGGNFFTDSPHLAAWAKEPDLWAFGYWYHEWAEARAKVTGVNAEKGTMSVDPKALTYGVRENHMFNVFNAFCELDREDEYVVDRKARRVYAWLPKDADARNAKISVAEGFLRGRVRDFALNGIVFEYATGNAILFDSAKRTEIVGCAVRHVGCTGIELRDAKDCRIAGCDVTDLGKGGISVNGGSWRSLTPGNCVIDNNEVAHFGINVPSGRSGIGIGGVGHRVTHNLVHHTTHQAITHGGIDNYIGFNVVHDSCNFTDDAGAIYCCTRNWAMRGTVIEYNLVHMTGKQPRGAHTEGIYLDDHTSGYKVRKNLINRASKGVYVGGGKDNEVSGNVVMNTPCPFSLGSRGPGSFAKQDIAMGTNSILWRAYLNWKRGGGTEKFLAKFPEIRKIEELAPLENLEKVQFALHALWNTVTNNAYVTAGAEDLQHWKDVGPYTVHAANERFEEDPGFVDYAGFNWELREDSPLRKKIGPTRFAEMGLYDSPERFSKARKFGEGVTMPRKLAIEFDAGEVSSSVVLSVKKDETAETVLEVPANVTTWGKRKDSAQYRPNKAFYDGWHDYVYTVTPLVDGMMTLRFTGSTAGKTLYDAVRVEGAELKGEGFELDADGTPHWKIFTETRSWAQGPATDKSEPFGVITEGYGEPAEGKRYGAANSYRQLLSEPFPVKKGRKLFIRFRAKGAL